MRYQICNRELRCPHCGGNDFTEGQGVFDTSAFVHLFRESATTFLCSQCGRLEWFLADWTADGNARIDNTTEAIECLACRAPIPAGEIRCPACGWTYKEGAPEPTATAPELPPRLDNIPLKTDPVPPEKIPAWEDRPGTDTECLVCHAKIPAWTDCCPDCGWTYKEDGESPIKVDPA
jgi:predicted nucleic-acid-binding Zn-ribbon protein